MMWVPPHVALAAVIVLTGCAQGAPEPPVRTPGAREIVTPAGAESGRPRLSAAPNGGALLSWSEPDGNQHVLRYAVWADTGWATPQTADSGPDWFVNWADTPGVVALPNGQMVAHTLVRQPAGGYAYDVRARVSDGTSWSDPVTPHKDGTAAEHGFVSVVPLGDRAGLVWLDGREQAGGHGSGAMTLRYATLGLDRELTDEIILDDRTCDCCPTTAVATPSGIVVAYRDRSQAEVRDISVVRFVDGGWTEPSIVHADDWTINACPVNGPALAASGDRVALAWFTGSDSSRVQLALSLDGGATFGDPIQIDDGNPVGRVSVAVLPSGDAAVGWLERVEGRAVFRVRRVEQAGTTLEPMDIATLIDGRESGVPQLVAVGDRVLAAWTDPESAAPLRSAVVTLRGR